MVRDITSVKYRFNWVENNVGPEGEVGLFICSCGEVIVEESDLPVYVTTHGCGHDEDEYIECDECGTKWEAVWKGMGFKKR